MAAIGEVDVKVNVYPVGLTIRDYFAAMAMSGMVSDLPHYDPRKKETPAEHVARLAFQIADAMEDRRDIDKGHRAFVTRGPQAE